MRMKKLEIRNPLTGFLFNLGAFWLKNKPINAYIKLRCCSFFSEMEKKYDFLLWSLGSPPSQNCAVQPNLQCPEKAPPAVDGSKEHEMKTI